MQVEGIIGFRSIQQRSKDQAKHAWFKHAASNRLAKKYQNDRKPLHLGKRFINRRYFMRGVSSITEGL